MSAERTVLVTGASGAVGPALVARLLSEGYRTRVLSRGRSPLTFPTDRVDVRAADVVDATAVRKAVAGADWVFHLAALLHVPGHPPELAPSYERVNVEGARVVARECARAGVARLVFFSTISVYGATAGAEPADEDSPPRPDSLYAESKLRGEAQVGDVGATGGLATTVLRLASVYGPHVKGNYSRLAQALRARWFVPIGPGQNRRTLVHEADVAEAAVLAAMRPEAVGRVYNVSDGRIHRLGEVVAAICRALGRRPPRLHLPMSLARRAAEGADLLLSAAGRGHGLASFVDKYAEDVAVRADRIQRELNFRPRFDVDEGWRDALRSGLRHPD